MMPLAVSHRLCYSSKRSRSIKTASQQENEKAMPTSSLTEYVSPEHLMRDARVAAALAWLRERTEETLAEQIAFCEVPAPPFGEEARGEHLLTRLKTEGLDDARRDTEGNIIA